MSATLARDSERSIYDTYLICKASFVACRQNPRVPHAALLDDELGRFEVWAANIGASRDFSSSLSLDSHLRDSQRPRQMVHMLLGILHLNLDYATKIFDEPEDTLLKTELPKETSIATIDSQVRSRHEIIAGGTKGSVSHGQPTLTAQEVAGVLSLEASKAIHDIISHLQRLSIAIRRASAREYNVQAARERDRMDGRDDVSDDERCMKALIEYRFPTALEKRVREAVKDSSSELADKPEELDKYSTADDVEFQNIRKFLTTAMSFRVRRFKYRKRQNEREAERQIRTAASRQTAPPKSQSTPSQLERNVNIDNLQKEPGRIGTLSPNNQDSERPSYNSALFEPPRSTTSSRISTGSTRSATGDIYFHWPGRPHLDDSEVEGRPIYKCPYCFDYLEVDDAQDKKRWRKHVKRDLEPYNCLFPGPECQADLKMFSSESQWLHHIRTKHFPGNWVCQIRSHATVFKSTNEDKFREHLRVQHEDEFPNSQLEAMMRASYRPHVDHHLFGDQCPLGCPPDPKSLQQESTKQRDPLPHHIANLLLSLALESLPMRDDDKSSKAENFDEAEDSVGSDQQQAEKRSQSGVSDISVSGSWGQQEASELEQDEAVNQESVIARNGDQSPTQVSREDEWGPLILWPPYAGVDTDPKLERFRTIFNQTSESARLTDRWFHAVERHVHPLIYGRHLDYVWRCEVKIAVLDTGIALNANRPLFLRSRAEKIVASKAFGDLDRADVDEDGHGTHIATAVLKTCPTARLYVARIARHAQNVHWATVVNAIEWAIDREVDIINMSFALPHTEISESSIPEPDTLNELRTALKKASNLGIILFSAASDQSDIRSSGVEYEADNVFVIDAASGDGHSSQIQPPADHTLMRFSAPGEDVLSACPTNMDVSGEMRLSSSSVATAIASGVAALVLSFFQHELWRHHPEYELDLGTYGIYQVFHKLLSVHGEETSPFLTPWKLFSIKQREGEAGGDEAATILSQRDVAASRILGCL